MYFNIVHTYIIRRSIIEHENLSQRMSRYGHWKYFDARSSRVIEQAIVMPHWWKTACRLAGWPINRNTVIATTSRMRGVFGATNIYRHMREAATSLSGKKKKTFSDVVRNAWQIQLLTMTRDKTTRDYRVRARLSWKSYYRRLFDRRTRCRFVKSVAGYNIQQERSSRREEGRLTASGNIIWTQLRRINSSRSHAKLAFWRRTHRRINYRVNQQREIKRATPQVHGAKRRRTRTKNTWVRAFSGCSLIEMYNILISGDLSSSSSPPPRLHCTLPRVKCSPHCFPSLVDSPTSRWSARGKSFRRDTGVGRQALGFPMMDGSWS